MLEAIPHSKTKSLRKFFPMVKFDSKIIILRLMMLH